MPKGWLGTEPGVWRTEAGMTAICLEARQFGMKRKIEKVTDGDRVTHTLWKLGLDHFHLSRRTTVA